MTNTRLAIIGAGAMGSAIALGLVQAQLYKAGEILLCDTVTERLDQLKQKGYQTTTELKNLATNTQKGQLETLLIAVKPKDMKSLLSELSCKNITESAATTVIVSIAAGVKLATYEEFFPLNPIIRVMPNTPAQVQRGASVLAPNARVKHQDLDRTMRMFESLGIALVMDESKLDAVTAVSGSGPAYIFYLIEAMTEAGIELGLTASDAEKLSIATAYGSGFLAYNHMQHSCAAEPVINKITDSARSLRKQVTSPNGTTHAAITSMDNAGVKQLLKAAIHAAAKRSAEMA